MRLHPVLASEWFTFTENNRDLLQKIGAVPTNDVYHPLWNEVADISLLFGGRGGGKSEAVVDSKLNDCLTEPYFRCYYGRKVFDTVRGSIFKTFVEGIKKNRLEKEFDYSEANTSSMIITCRSNGHQFIPFGSDKPDKIKSIKDPTDVICEEFDQFLFADFREIYPTLRTPRGAARLYGMFNTHGVYPDHWLIKLFFPDLYIGEEDIEFDLEDLVKVQKIFANYTDNLFIDRDAYKNRLMLAAGGNIRLFEAIANGAWGVVENENPWLFNFDYDKHVQEVPFLPTFEVFVSFDFNVNPFACTIWQKSPQKGLSNSFIHCIDEIVGKIKLEDICYQIRAKYPSSIIYVTGDRSGKNEDVGRNQTLYQMIESYLAPNAILNLIDSNLEHSDSRELCNAMFYRYPNIKISPKCINLIQDCQKATVDMDSNKPSHLKKDRQGFKMDTFDSMRYFFQTYFHKFAKDTYFRVINKR